MARNRDSFAVVVHVLLFRPAAGSADHDKREVFLLRRAGTGFMDGCYVPPGGHLRAGERLADAAARECREEAGVMPADLTPLGLVAYHAGDGTGLNMVFEGRGVVDGPGIAEPESFDAGGWFPVSRLPEPTAPWVGEALELARAGVWFRDLPRR